MPISDEYLKWILNGNCIKKYSEKNINQHIKEDSNVNRIMNLTPGNTKKCFCSAINYDGCYNHGRFIRKENCENCNSYIVQK